MQLAVTIGVVLLVYIMLVPLIGAGQALVAVMLGDDTAQEEGYLSLNPMAHASLFWMFLLVISQTIYNYMPFGLGRPVPITESNFTGKLARLRYIISLFSNSFISYILAVGCFSTLLSMHGVTSILVLYQNPTIKNLYTLFPDASSLSLVVTFMLVTGFIMASFGAALVILLNIYQMCQPHITQKTSEKGFGTELVTFVFLFLILSFCADPLCKMGIHSVMILSYKIVTMLGILV